MNDLGELWAPTPEQHWAKQVLRVLYVIGLGRSLSLLHTWADASPRRVAAGKMTRPK